MTRHKHVFFAATFFVASLSLPVARQRNLSRAATLFLQTCRQRDMAPGSPFAYVSLLAGVSNQGAHRGMMYSILVAARRLKALGSTADMVAIVAGDPLGTLDAAVCSWHGLKIEYVEDDVPWPRNVATLTKVVVWRLTEYRAVQYLDADVLPLRNMDAFFQIEADLAATAGIHEPFHGGWFMARPDCATFDALVGRIAEHALPWLGTWGPPATRDVEWATCKNATHRGWNFIGVRALDAP